MTRDKLYPGYRHVTDIIDVFQKFSIPKKKLEELAERGTKVHNAITSHLRGEFVVLDDELEMYFSAFEKFQKENKFEIVATEQRYFDHDEKITGEVDTLLKFEGDEYPTIVDFKTSRLENAPIWKLQGAFYCALLNKNKIAVENKFRFVQLGGNYGMYFIREYEYSFALLDICLAALKAHRYFYPEGS